MREGQLAKVDATIIFDTDCVLCAGMVRFILAHERAPFFNFAGARSRAGLDLARCYGFSRSDLDRTFLVIVDGVVFQRSDAGVELLRRMRAPWSWLALIRIVPRTWRDPVYDALARRRMDWFGRAACYVPPVEYRERFLDLDPG